jgi:hypothetical protein
MVGKAQHMTLRWAFNTANKEFGRYTNTETYIHDSLYSASKPSQQVASTAYIDREKNWLDRKHRVSQYRLIWS